MKPNDELRHLFHGSLTNEQIGGLGKTIGFYAYCPGNASFVLKKCRDIMQIILTQDYENWPSPSSWRLLLPEWFVQQCSKDISQEEADKIFALPPSERSLHPLWNSWSVDGWIYYFEEEERYWYWWDASVLSKDRLLLEVEVEDDPFSWESLKWLLITSGASHVFHEMEYDGN